MNWVKLLDVYLMNEEANWWMRSQSYWESDLKIDYQSFHYITDKWLWDDEK